MVDCSTAREMACRDNEMGYMFYHNLGGSKGQNKTGNQTAIGGQQLTSIQGYYWTGTAGLFGDACRTIFSFGDGGVTINVGMNDRMSGWAVREGDVASVPEPSTLLLLGSGLIGLWGLGKKFKK